MKREPNPTACPCPTRTGRLQHCKRRLHDLGADAIAGGERGFALGQGR